MNNRRIIFATAVLASLTGCSGADKTNNEVQAANTADTMGNTHNEMMANGMMPNGMMQNGMMQNGIMHNGMMGANANGAAASSGMPADGNAAVNEHVAHQENKSQ